MENKEKIVDFTWCKRCKYYERSESEDPCWDCLEDPVNTNSRKPIKFKDVDE